MAILRDRLDVTAAERPELAAGVSDVLARCESWAGSLAGTRSVPRPIHRDFYADQVLIDGPRTYVIDLDLYAVGDSALDLGNFLAHVAEYALRRFGHADALANHERAMAEAYAAASADVSPGALAAWKWLSLARHVYLSTRFEERWGTTGRLIGLLREARAAP